MVHFFVVFSYIQIYQLDPRKNVQAMFKKIAGRREKLKMLLNIVNAIWKQFFKSSKFSVEENKKERCNMDDVEGLLMFTV